MNKKSNTRRGFTQPANAVIKKGHSRGIFPRHLSSRNVLMRDIGATHMLYPAFIAARRVGVTERVARGFTFIELLVVVLIIGILATVALPQYQKAVVKSQYMSLKPLVRSIVEAQKRYYLENGAYAAKFEDLDISLPAPTRSFFQSNNDYYQYPWGKLIIDNSHAAGFADTKFKIRYELYIDGKQQCMIDKSYEIGHKICKEDSGLSSPSSSYGTNDIYYW